MHRLIAAVRKYPCLWNTAAIEYRDQELKDAAWAEVMKETDLSSVKEVKLKWKKLRDSYRDALKRTEQAREGKRAAPWKYTALMQFLQPHMGARKRPGPPPAANGQASSAESDSEPDSEPKRKNLDQLALIDRKLDYLCKTQPKRQATEASSEARAAPAQPAPDALDVFFSSMCQSTKRFPFPTQIKIKKTLFSAVIEAEEALVAEQQSYASLWARGASSSSSEEEEAKPS